MKNNSLNNFFGVRRKVLNKSALKIIKKLYFLTNSLRNLKKLQSFPLRRKKKTNEIPKS